MLVDTAGRLHTRVNLMNELDKIGGSRREVPGAPHECCSCSTVGQNGCAGARVQRRRRQRHRADEARRHGEGRRAWRSQRSEAAEPLRGCRDRRPRGVDEKSVFEDSGDVRTWTRAVLPARARPDDPNPMVGAGDPRRRDCRQGSRAARRTRSRALDRRSRAAHAVLHTRAVQSHRPDRPMHRIVERHRRMVAMGPNPVSGGFAFASRLA